jgi:hypothetical protein
LEGKFVGKDFEETRGERNRRRHEPRRGGAGSLGAGLDALSFALSNRDGHEKKPKPDTQPLQKDPKALRIPQKHSETLADAVAHASLRPTVQAAMTLLGCNKDVGEMSINTLVADLEKQCNLASKGELVRAEALLMTQAHTLDALFNNLARRAAVNIGEYMIAAETYLCLALKAQRQLRSVHIAQLTLQSASALSGSYPFSFPLRPNRSTHSVLRATRNRRLMLVRWAGSTPPTNHTYRTG